MHMNVESCSFFFFFFLPDNALLMCLDGRRGRGVSGV